MSDILADLPILLPCLVRREFTLNFEGGRGEYLAAHVLGVRCQEGHSLQFQVRFEEPGYGGAMFCLPIQALCWKPCPLPPTELIQPWDCFSRHFAVHEFRLLRNSSAILLNTRKVEGFPERLSGRYLCTIDYADSALAEQFEQHKQAHLIQVEAGWFAAVPNNRVLMHDSAFASLPDELPKFKSLAANFCGEVTFHLPTA